MSNTSSDIKLIYKVVTRTEWDLACTSTNKIYPGATIDKNDGYIHFSTKEQAKETVQKWFHGQDNLLLISFDTKSFQQDNSSSNNSKYLLKWEVSRNNALFPHLYCCNNNDNNIFGVSTDLAINTYPLIMNSDGSHTFPDNF